MLRVWMLRPVQDIEGKKLTPRDPEACRVVIVYLGGSLGDVKMETIT